MSVKGNRGRGEEQIDDSWWAGLVGRVLHPIQVQIIEALRWIDQPLSVGEFVEIAEGELQCSVFIRHIRRLSKLGAIELAERPSSRNPLEARIRLVAPLRDEDI